MTDPDRCIEIVGWERFQHYKDRNPPWIKTYTELLSSEAYLRLTGHRRAILHGLWLDYATKHGELSDDTLMISRRLSLKVTTSDLRALEAAGFIALPSHSRATPASSPLAERLQPASASRALARGREKTEEPQGSGVNEKSKSKSKSRTLNYQTNGHHDDDIDLTPVVAHAATTAGLDKDSDIA